MIRIESLNKYYNKGKSNELHVINQTTITLPDSGLLCILGESGSGKTTLMNVISGLDSFSGGVIEVDNVQIKKFGSKVQEKVRNEKFGYIFQNYYLLMDRTVEYNIMLALSMYNISDEEKESRIDYVLNAVNMLRYKKRLVSQLSGGQQQRVAIARALVKSPKVIFADEPTGNLDEANTMNIMGILKKISKECLVVIVTHEKTIAEFFADKILWITDGQIEREEDRESSSVYQYVDDSNLYLQEFQKKEIQSKDVALEIYGDMENQKLAIQIVYENGKLYLSAGEGTNVEFLTDNNEKKVIDSKRPILEEKDANNIAFELETVEAAKRQKMKFSEIVEIAGKNRKNLGVKQIFLAVTLFIMSIMVVLSVQEILSVVMLDTSSIISKDTHYYKLSSPKLKDSDISLDVYQENFGQMIEALLEEGFEVYGIPNTTLQYPYKGIVQMENSVFEIKDYCFVSVEKIGKDKLLYGEMPEETTEVVLDRLMIEQFLKSSAMISNVITDMQQMIGNTLTTKQGIDLTIVGISDSGQPDIYVQPELILKLYRENFRFITEEEAEKQYSDYKRRNLGITEDGKVEVLVSYGALINAYTEYISKTYGAVYTQSKNIEKLEQMDYPQEEIEREKEKLKELEEEYGLTAEQYIERLDSVEDALAYSYEGVLSGKVHYIVVGYYDIETDADYIVPEEAVPYYDRALLNNSTACYVYADAENPETMKEKIVNAIPEEIREFLILHIENEADQVISAYKEENQEKLQGRLLIVFTIFMISMVILYFVMKTNVVDRVNDLGVYRMLGISKINIVGMFACENFMITSYTSVPGVLFISLISLTISRIESLGVNMIYPWYAVILTILFFYAANILVGILPVLGLLRLPPAQLAAKYDI